MIPLDSASRKLGLRQKDVASMLDVDEQTMTNWESAIRQNTPSDIELTSIQEEETKIVIRGKANSNPDIGKYMRTLSETVGEPSLLEARREDDKSVSVLTVEKTKRHGNGR